MEQFFSDEIQEKIKYQAAAKSNNDLTLEDYIKILKNYRNLFLTELLNLKVTHPSGSADKFTADFYTDVINNHVTYISSCFDEIIGILEPLLFKTPLDNPEFREKFLLDLTDMNGVLPVLISKLTSLDIAKIRLKKYIETYCTGWSKIRNLSVSVPLFRARKKGRYSRDIHELYHVPFSKKNLLSNERFSSKSAPMLYLSETIEGTLHETKLKFEDANFALFFPKFSNFYNNYFFDIKNSVQAELNAVKLKELRCTVEYDNKYFTFSRQNALKYLGEFLLFQILHYPVYAENSNDIIPQYVIPQMIMELESLEKYFSGIVYHSASSICNRGIDAFGNRRDMNVCFYVPAAEDSTAEYNETYLNNFFTALWFQGDTPVRSFQEVSDLCEDVHKNIRTQVKNGYIMTDYSQYVIQIESHIESMKQIDANYMVSECGKVEATLFADFLNEIMPIVENPEAYNVLKYSDKNQHV